MLQWLSNLILCPVFLWQNIKIAKKLGFSFYRMAKGDHEAWGRPTDGRVAIIPHQSGDLKRKTLKSILESFQISPEEFLKLKKGK